MEDQFNCEASGHACILVIVKLMKSHLRPLATNLKVDQMLNPNGVSKLNWFLSLLFS